jgi:hypothetical protein
MSSPLRVKGGGRGACSGHRRPWIGGGAVVDDGKISDAKLVVEHEEDVPVSLGARLTGSSTALKPREEGLLRGDPPPAHRAAHNFYKVVMAHHLKRVRGRTCMGVLVL